MPAGNAEFPKRKKPGEPGFFDLQNCLNSCEYEIGAQKRTRTSTPFRVPAPEAGASTNSAIWATSGGVRAPRFCVNRVFEVFLKMRRKVEQTVEGQ
jgi:hypothetical protein